jgi:hypothetical protein
MYDNGMSTQHKLTNQPYLFRSTQNKQTNKQTNKQIIPIYDNSIRTLHLSNNVQILPPVPAFFSRHFFVYFSESVDPVANLVVETNHKEYATHYELYDHDYESSWEETECEVAHD